MEIFKLFATGGIGAAALLCIQILLKGFLDRRKTNADAMVTEVNGEVALSKAALDFLAAVRLDAQKQIEAARADSTASVAGARADAANSVAQALHEVSTARGEAGQMRLEVVGMRNTVERIEQLMLRVRDVIWTPGAEDPRVSRARELLGDGSAPFSAFQANGSR